MRICEIHCVCFSAIKREWQRPDCFVAFFPKVNVVAEALPAEAVLPCILRQCDWLNTKLVQRNTVKEISDMISPTCDVCHLEEVPLRRVLT
jgi:hypothetical protein